MRTTLVVEVEPAREPLPELASGLIGVEVNALILERPPETLDHHVVHPTPLAVHRDPDAGLLEGGGEGEACELTALIRIEDLGPLITLQGVLKSSNAEVCVKVSVGM